MLAMNSFQHQTILCFAALSNLVHTCTIGTGFYLNNTWLAYWNNGEKPFHMNNGLSDLSNIINITSWIKATSKKKQNLLAKNKTKQKTKHHPEYRLLKYTNMQING